MGVLLMVMAIRRCRPVTRGFVAAGVAASMLKRLTGSLPFELVRRSGRQVLVVSGP